MFAPSSLVSASVRASEPVCSVLIIALVKSWRICTVDRFEPNDCACDRSVVRAAVKSVVAAAMLPVSAQVLAGGAIDRPLALKSTAGTVTGGEPRLFNVRGRWGVGGAGG